MDRRDQNLPDEIPEKLYSPLDEENDEIRLITLLPRSDGSPVHCQLTTVSLASYRPEYREFLSARDSTRTKKQEIAEDWLRWSESCSLSNSLPLQKRYRFEFGDYAALSYVWGDPTLSSKIFINGCETEVTVNLAAALRELSGDQDFVSGYKLWVDAICINQHDLDERGRQVGRMQKIYDTAWSTPAWLGEEGNGSGAAIALIRRLSSLAAYAKGEEVEANLRQSPGCLGLGCWLTLHNLMQRPYWTRLWIIQEIVLGGPTVVIRCGRHSIGWPLFCIGVRFLFGYLWTVKDKLLEHDRALYRISDHSGWSTQSLHLIQLLRELSQSSDRRSDYESFGQLLDIARPAFAKDVRDKAYGLVGIMDPTVAAQLVPNYRIPPSMVFTAVAKAFIIAGGNLEPLREGNPWSETRTPSWAADWSWAGRMPLSRVGSRLAAPPWGLKDLRELGISALPYQASRDSAMKIYFSSDNTTITCKGFLVDAISGLSARGDGYFEWDCNSIVQPQSWRNAYGDIAGMAKALYQTLVADRVGYGEKASERHAAILSLPSRFQGLHTYCRKRGWRWLSAQEGYYFRWEKWREANKDFLLGERRFDEYFSEIIPSDASELDYNEVFACYDRTGKGRRLITTIEGYLGWAPDNIYGSAVNQTKKGDLVAIILGCSTPILLRPYGEYFQVVGETYIQGLMDGEAMEFLKSGVCQLQDFTLC